MHGLSNTLGSVRLPLTLIGVQRRMDVLLAAGLGAAALAAIAAAGAGFLYQPADGFGMALLVRALVFGLVIVALIVQLNG